MLYTRLNDRKDGFEPQRNVMTTASGLDGGGTLAADPRGNVFVAWHAQGQQNGKPIEGEGHRRVWLARSSNQGTTFEPERPVSPAQLGACGCCGMGALADESGNLYLLYRSARETVHRDMDQQAVLDFEFLAIGRLAVVAKRIMEVHYGRPPEHSYCVGCSTGGREAMLMSQRYPFYFDGVVAGTPAMRTGLFQFSRRLRLP